MIRLGVGLFLIAVPVLELALLIKIGQWIGVWTTVAIVITTAFAGILIISQQSFAVLRQTLEAVSEGRSPVRQVLDGLFLMLAGALLLTPGLITDAAALLLLVPPIRRAVARWSIGQLLRHTPAEFRTGQPSPRNGAEEWRPPNDNRDGPVIEGEFERLGETPTNSRRGNGTSLS